MTFPIYFNTKKTVNLFGVAENFNFIKNLYLENKLPKVLMLTGKITLIFPIKKMLITF